MERWKGTEAKKHKGKNGECKEAEKQNADE